MAKNLLSINKTDDREARDFDGNPYLAAHVSAEVRAMLDNAFSSVSAETEPPAPTAEEKADRARMKQYWILCGGSLLAGLACIAVANSLGLYASAPYLHVMDLGLLAAAIVFNFKARKVSRRLTKQDETRMNVDFAEAARRLEDAAATAARELGVPRGAATVDVFPFHYKVSGDKLMGVGKKNRFDNISVSVFREGDFLCLATAQELFRIPVTAVKGYRTVDEDYEIDMWLKPEEPSSETYKTYNIRKSGFLSHRARTYYAVVIRGEGGEYELLVPAYDFEVLRGVLDIPSL